MDGSDTEYDPLTLVSELFPRLIRVVMAEISPAVQKSLQLNQSQIKVLMILGRYSSCTMSTLGMKTGLERGSMTAVVTALAERALVERRRSNRDRRSVVVTLTDSGRRTASVAGGSANFLRISLCAACCNRTTGEE